MMMMMMMMMMLSMMCATPRSLVVVRRPGTPVAALLPQGRQGGVGGSGDLGVVSAQAVARRAHNERIRYESGTRHCLSALYFKQHIDKLRPFVLPHVLASIEARARAAPTDFQLPEPVTEQPAAIKGEMREYQLAGLAWLVRQYDHGVNAILADEVRCLCAV
jgi:hypothetical protein